MIFPPKSLVVPNIVSNFALDLRITGSAEVRPANVKAHRSGRSGHVRILVVVFLFIINAKNEELGIHNDDYVPREAYNQTKYNMDKKEKLPKDIADFTYNTYAKIAAAFIADMPTCHVHYGFDHNEHRYVLCLEHTGLYLRDLRCWLPGNMTLKYGYTQDTIIVIDKNHA